jgi:hypothetical protein
MVRSGTPGSVGVGVPHLRQKRASAGSAVWQLAQVRSVTGFRMEGILKETAGSEIRQPFGRGAAARVRGEG